MTVIVWKAMIAKRMVTQPAGLGTELAMSRNYCGRIATGPLATRLRVDGGLGYFYSYFVGNRY
jgi:hypothetical protein